MKHPFGGIWTQKKLEVLEKYLGFYTLALKNQSFRLHYADAFAGTGSHTPKRLELGQQEELIDIDDLKGSVSKALEVAPGFHQYHFNDLNPKHIEALEEVATHYPEKRITIHQSDANDFVPEFCQSLGRNDRAVLLLDPYSTQLNWSTLNDVARSEKVDLWLLFPISALSRMTPRDGGKIQESWRNTLNRLLGTDDWQDALYKPKALPPMDDLFGHSGEREETERINVQELQSWVSGRLNELFPFVAEPVPLRSNGSLLFLFYFAVSNPHPAAGALAKKVVSDILSKYR
jgi:three-Cys-motif partner protein